MAILPMSAIVGIVSTRMVIEHFGAAAYAQYGLLIGIGNLLPFADLGMSAAVVNVLAASDDPGRDTRVHAVLVSAIRVLVASAAVILALALALTLFDAWPSILGPALRPGASLSAGLCLGLVGAALPLGIGQRALVGLGRNHVSIAIQGLQSPIVLVVIAAVVGLGWRAGNEIATVPYAITLVLAVVSTWAAARIVRPALGAAVKAAGHLRQVRGAPVFNVAWPMLVQMVALPLAMQTDRVVLSHVSNVRELASYNLASQMFTPVWQVTAAAGAALWPIFARARARQESSATSPIATGVVFAAAATLACVVIAGVSGTLTDLASNGSVQVGRPLLMSFSAFMIFQAAKYPLGMYLTSAPGLRFQAYMILLMVPVNLGLSWVLALRWGAVGPVVGSAVGVLVFQVLANWWYVRCHLALGQPHAHV